MFWGVSSLTQQEACTRLCLAHLRHRSTNSQNLPSNASINSYFLCNKVAKSFLIDVCSLEMFGIVLLSKIGPSEFLCVNRSIRQGMVFFSVFQ